MSRKRQLGDNTLAAVGIAAVTVLEAIALMKGIDGAFLVPMTGAILALVGVKAGQWYERTHDGGGD